MTNSTIPSGVLAFALTRLSTPTKAGRDYGTIISPRSFSTTLPETTASGSVQSPSTTPRSSSASVHETRSKRSPSLQSVISPYSVREPDDADHERFVKLTRERGHLLTFPTVRPIEHDSDGGASANTAEDAYEVVIGHRRVATARKADLGTIAVRLRELDDWEAVEHFVDDHIPIPGANENGLYSQQEIEQAITRLRADWLDKDLLDLGPLAPYLREHLAATRQGALRHRDRDGRS